MYRIVWTSRRNGHQGRGIWLADRREAEAWVRLMNIRHQWTHWHIEEDADARRVAEEVARDLFARLRLTGHRA